MNMVKFQGKKVLLLMHYRSMEDVELEKTKRICIVRECHTDKIVLEDAESGYRFPIPPVYTAIQPIDSSYQWKLGEFGERALGVNLVMALVVKMQFSLS